MTQQDQYLEVIRNVASSSPVEKSSLNSFYSLSYKPILRFFQQNQYEFTIDTFYQGLAMVYGWMPTSPGRGKPLESILTECNPVLSYFTKAYSEDISNHIMEMKAYTNNSMVGLSKLLHFINPQLYPIWDSKIASLFGLKYNYQINNVSHYLLYRQAIRIIADERKLTLRELESKLFAYADHNTN